MYYRQPSISLAKQLMNLIRSIFFYFSFHSFPAFADVSFEKSFIRKYSGHFSFGIFLYIFYIICNLRLIDCHPLLAVHKKTDVSSNPQLCPTFIIFLSCGTDSYLVNYHICIVVHRIPPCL